MGARLHLPFCACKTARFPPELQVSVGHRPHLSFYVCKTACLASQLLVSLGPIPHLWFLDAKERLLDQNNKSLWVPEITCRFVHWKQRDWHKKNWSRWAQPSSVVSACKTTTSGPEWQISMGPRPHLWLFHAKQRPLYQNNKCLWVPNITCRCVHVQQRA